MIKKLNLIVCILSMSILFNGCWDYKDINRRGILLSVGVDEIKGEIQFTGEVAKLFSPTKEQQASTRVTDVYTFKSSGRYFEGARQDFENKTPLTDFSGAVRTITFSKSFAENGIEQYLNRIYFLSQYRSSILITVFDGNTENLFNTEIINDISVGYAIEDTIKKLNESGAAIYKTVQQIQSDIQFKSIGYLVPYITREDGTIKYLGLAAMKNSKLVGVIKSENSKGFLYLLAKKPTINMVIQIPEESNNIFSLTNILKKRKIRTYYKDGKVNIDIDLKFNTQLQYEYFLENLNKEELANIEKEVSNKIKKDVMYALERSQKEFKCDVFGFARYFKGKYPNIYKELTWEDAYDQAVFNVNVKTTLINTRLLDVVGKK